MALCGTERGSTEVSRTTAFLPMCTSLNDGVLSRLLPQVLDSFELSLLDICALSGNYQSEKECPGSCIF